MSATDTATTSTRPRLKTRYDEQIRAQLKDTLGLGNIMEVPRLEKIVLNMGVGAAVGQPSLLEGAVRDLTQITGQKPLVTRATMQGGIIDKDMPIPVSNVALLCPKDGPTRVGYKIDGGEKVRICKKCGNEV